MVVEIGRWATLRVYARDEANKEWAHVFDVGTAILLKAVRSQKPKIVVRNTLDNEQLTLTVEKLYSVEQNLVVKCSGDVRWVIVVCISYSCACAIVAAFDIQAAALQPRRTAPDMQRHNSWK